MGSRKSNMDQSGKPGVKITGLAAAFAIAAASLWMPYTGTEAWRAHAAEFTVTAAVAVLYSKENAKVYKQPDVNSGIVTVLAKDLPVDVTGVTSNGWFQISLNGIYYVPGDGLVSRNAEGNNGVITETDITQLTKGTFSFYKSNELDRLDQDDIEDMDENTYIKYLDSYLTGYAVLDFCILRNSGKTLKEVYSSEAKVDQKVAALSMQTYLINYRNQYLVNSLAGPFRNEKELKLAMNRAIRYDIGKFWTIFKNSSVGSDEAKMRKLVENVVNEMKAEQGVIFTCSMKYGSYKANDGSEGNGWTIEITKKD